MQCYYLEIRLCPYVSTVLVSFAFWGSDEQAYTQADFLFFLLRNQILYYASCALYLHYYKLYHRHYYYVLADGN